MDEAHTLWTNRNGDAMDSGVKNHVQQMAKAIQGLAYRHSAHNVFSDFIEMAAISLSNAVDLRQAPEREARYMQIVAKYQPEEIQTFPKLLGQLVEAFEDGPADYLGALFHELELHNTYKGQFFTPYELCRMMAKFTMGDEAEARAAIEKRGFITVSEPAAGGGAMVIALADEFKRAGINYQHHMHVTAVDVDIRCVHMAYVQFALMHIPAQIVHGNTLTLEEFGHWYTPAHIMGLWAWKLRRRDQDHPAPAPIAQIERPAEPEAPQPTGKPLQLTLF